MRILLLIIVSYLLSMFFSFSLTFLIMVLFLSILLIYDVIKYRCLKDEKLKKERKKLIIASLIVIVMFLYGFFREKAKEDFQEKSGINKEIENFLKN